MDLMAVAGAGANPSLADANKELIDFVEVHVPVSLTNNLMMLWCFHLLLPLSSFCSWQATTT
jgi:hypothetical protein